MRVDQILGNFKQEQKMAQALEELGEEGLVLSYVKNQNLGFSIPYTLNGEEHNYLPDFIVRIGLASPLAGEPTLFSPFPLAGEAPPSSPSPLVGISANLSVPSP